MGRTRGVLHRAGAIALSGTLQTCLTDPQNTPIHTSPGDVVQIFPTTHEYKRALEVLSNCPLYDYWCLENVRKG